MFMAVKKLGFFASERLNKTAVVVPRGRHNVFKTAAEYSDSKTRLRPYTF